MSAPGELRRALPHRGARPRGHHQRGPRAPRVLRLARGDRRRPRPRSWRASARAGRAVLNGDDPLVRRIGEAFAGEVLWFGRDRRHHVSGENWRGTAFGGPLRPRHRRAEDGRGPAPARAPLHDELPGRGRGGPRPGDRRRARWRKRWRRSRRASTEARCGSSGGNVILIDDCYNSSPEALDAAVLALSMAGGERRVAVLGDMLELGPSSAGDPPRARPGLRGQASSCWRRSGPWAASSPRAPRGPACPWARSHLFADAAEAAAQVPDLVRAGRRGAGEGFARREARGGRGRARRPLRGGGPLRCSTTSSTPSGPSSAR